MKVVLATGNAGKIKEMSALLSALKIEVIPQTVLHIPDVAETGLTFVENAIIKARHAAKQAGMPALADDSGLVVPALKGAPGLYSARYAGVKASNEANRKKLLQDMQGLSGNERNAYFFCALAFIRHETDPTPLVCQGIWHGEILTEEKGSDGFGYDPLFWVPTHLKSAAELPLPIKNQISHRGLALQQLMTQLSDILCTPSTLNN